MSLAQSVASSRKRPFPFYIPTNCILALRGDLGRTGTGGVLSSWTDYSPVAGNATASLGSVTYDTNPWVTFNGSSTLAVNSICSRLSPTTNQPMTVLCLARHRSVGVILSSVLNGSLYSLQFQNSVLGRFSIGKVGGGSASLQYTLGPASDEWAFFGAAIAGTTADLLLNEDVVTDNGAFSVPGPMSADTTARIGGRQGIASWTGDLASLTVCNADITGAELDRVRENRMEWAERYLLPSLWNPAITTRSAAPTVTYYNPTQVPYVLLARSHNYRVTPNWSSAALTSGNKRTVVSFGSEANCLRFRHNGTGVVLEAIENSVVRATTSTLTIAAAAAITINANPSAGTVSVSGVAGPTGTAWSWPAGTAVRLGGILGSESSSGDEFDGTVKPPERA